MVRANTSRPYWSVPNQKRAEGGRSRLIEASLNGSPLIHGAASASTTRQPRISAPTKMVGLRRMPVASRASRPGAAASSRVVALIVQYRMRGSRKA